MSEEQNQDNLEEERVAWRVKEYDKHERSKQWYIVSISLTLALLLFAFFTSNFLFAVIIIIASLVIILHDGQEPTDLEVVLAEEGVFVGRNFFDYDDLRDFAIVYKPSQGIKKLYFEFENMVKPRLSFELGEMDPLMIRDFLLRYLPEDLDRTDEPLSEGIARILKL